MPVPAGPVKKLPVQVIKYRNTLQSKPNIIRLVRVSEPEVTVTDTEFSDLEIDVECRII